MAGIYWLSWASEVWEDWKNDCAGGGCFIRLLPCAKLDFHCPAGAVDRGELGNTCLIRIEIGQHQMPCVSRQPGAARLLARLLRIRPALGPPGFRHLVSRPHPDETTAFALTSRYDLEIENVFRSLNESRFREPCRSLTLRPSSAASG